MKIINFIDQPGVIKAILQHVGLWGALGTLLLTLQNVKSEKYYEDNKLHRPARGHQSDTSAYRTVGKRKPPAAKDKAPTIRILC